MPLVPSETQSERPRTCPTRSFVTRLTSEMNALLDSQLFFGSLAFLGGFFFFLLFLMPVLETRRWTPTHCESGFPVI